MHFTESHEWIQIDGEIGTVGITAYAQKELGEIVYVELPLNGRVLQVAQEAAVLESTKAASDVYTPVSGQVIAVNEELKQNCNLINRYPESEGWLFKIKMGNLSDLETLLDRDDYLSLVRGS
jgi:glycine cleavage system H protein